MLVVLLVCVCVCTIFSFVPRPLPYFQCLGRLGLGGGYTIATSCHSTKAAPQCHFIDESQSIGPVRDLTVQPTSTSAPSTLQVSWSKPGIIDFLTLCGETYHLTLSSTQGTHTFNVSNSVKILSGVVDKAYYSKTIISLLATTFTDQYCRLVSSGIQAIS